MYKLIRARKFTAVGNGRLLYGFPKTCLDFSGAPGQMTSTNLNTTRNYREIYADSVGCACILHTCLMQRLAK